VPALPSDSRQLYTLLPLDTNPADTDPRPRPHRLARLSGVLVGFTAQEGAYVWAMSKRDGEITPLVWPRGYRARFQPLELLNEALTVVASGGRSVTVVGGFLPEGYGRRPLRAASMFAVHSIIEPGSEL